MTAAPAGAQSRAVAASALQRVRFGGLSLRAVMPSIADGLADPRDRALAESSVFAVCRGLFRYEAVLARLLKRPLGRGDAQVHALLLIGLAQLDALGMAAHGVVDACVGASRTLGRGGHAGLVNALLRRFLREKPALDAALADDPQARLNHPTWLIDAIRDAWGDAAESVMQAANQPPPLWIRINRRRISSEAYDAALDEAGIRSSRLPHLPEARCLIDPPAARTLPGWSDGWVSVQDAAAQGATLALACEPGMRVLDACAAPGGKTAALLESIDALDVLAIDRDARRMQRMPAALQRLGLDARCMVADVGDPERWWTGDPFDRILLDAPCSATGILRRQPDIRWHRRAADIAPLCALQSRLLDALWPLLAPGGRLVYATCSILPEENADQIDAFLVRHPGARAVSLDARFGRRSGAGRQRLPGDDNADGFFVAALEHDQD